MLFSTRLVSSLFVIMLVLVSTSYVSAQTTTASSTEAEIPGIVENLGDRATDFRDRITNARTESQGERQGSLQAKTQERITNLAANISNRFDAIIDRLQNITDRLALRIEKMNTEGYDTSLAKSSLELTQSALSDARTELLTIDADVASVVGSPTPKAQWQTVRSSFLSARDSIKIAHGELKNAIIHLKAAPQSATSTIATSTEAILVN